MNVSQLQSLPQSQVQRVTRDGQDKDADYMALRLLNKRARVRLSPEPISLEQLPGRGVLFAVGNHVGLFAAVTRTSDGGSSLIISALSDLRNAFSSSTSDEIIPFAPLASFQLYGTPNIIAFCHNETKLLVGLVQGQILVYDVLSSSPGNAPIHTFASPSGRPPREILPNPEGMPSLVAVLYDTDGAAGAESVVIYDLQTMQSTGGWTNGGTPETTPTSLSWSPKGKQLAIGLQSGDIISFSPSDTTKIKSFVPKPTSLNSQTLISATWLSNSDFHAVYVPQGPLTPETEQSHLILSLDAKANTSTEVKLSNPYIPFSSTRLPGSFTVVFRNWDPAKFLLFIGDSTSSDIGLVGCTPDPSGPHSESWTNYSLEETSTPTVPLDQDSNDTVLMGLALDLTGTQTFNHKTASGEDAELPPPPVMYAYASDGTVVGWNILNTQGTPYPGMVSGSSGTAVTQQSSVDSMQESIEALPKPPVSVFSQPAPQASSVFSQPSTSTNTAPAFPPPIIAFGDSSLPGSAVYTSPGYSQPSMFAASSTPSAFSTRTTTTSGGFGAFANAAPAKFGQPTPAAFGFGGGNASASSLAPTSSNQALASPMSMSMSTTEETMAAESETDSGMGGLSLGGGSHAAESKPGLGATGMFGALPTVTPSAEANKGAHPAFGSTSAFGGSIKPAAGFGAFGGAGTSAFGQSAFGGAASGSGTSGDVPAALKPANAPSSAFGSTGFGGGAASAFGQSAFGQSAFGKPSFGASSFGSTGFGSTPASTVPATTTTTPSTGGFGGSSGGFASFASGGVSGFGKAATAPGPAGLPPKPVWAALGNEEDEKKIQAPSAFSAPTTTTSGFGGMGSASAFAPVTAPVPPTPEAPPPSTPPRPAQSTLEPESPAPDATSTPVKQSVPSTPDSSPFKVMGTGPTTGAFANLTTSPGFGKLEHGFGAFGGSAFSSSSPFANPKPTGASPFASTGAFGGTPSSSSASAAGGSTSATPTKPSVFGSPSPLGSASVFGKPSTATPVSAFGSPSASTTPGVSAFATPATPPVVSAFGKSSWATPAGMGPPSTTPPSIGKVGGGFGAYAAKGSGGFAAFSAGGAKSFSDMLKSEKDGEEGKKNKEDETKTETPPVSVFSRPTEVSIPEPETPEKDRSGTEPSEGEEEEDSYREGEEEEEEEEDEGSSFLSQSFSESSGQEAELSTVLEVEEEEEEEEEDLPEEEDEEDTPREPANVPLPLSRTPSLTAKSPAPSIHLTTPSPPSSPLPADKGKAKQQQSTTPPGSPEPSTPAILPTPPPIPAAGLSLGLGRPSTRPVRSSPLANAPISRDDESSEDGSPRKPKVDTSTQGLKTFMPSPLPSPKEERSGSVSPRPKTPPLLSTTPTPKPAVFSAPVTAAPAVKQPFTVPSSTTPPPTVPAPAPSTKTGIFSSPFTGFGKPAADTAKKAPPTTTGGGLFPTPAAPSFGGLFGKLPTPPPAVGPSTTPKPAPTTFSQPTPISAGQVPPTVPSNAGFLGTKPATAPPAFTPPPAGFFANKAASSSMPSLPSGGLFGHPAKPTSAPASAASMQGGGIPFGMGPPKGVPMPVPVKPVEPSPSPLEAGMQAECVNIYLSLTKELEKLKVMAQEANQKKVELYRPSSGRRTIADLGDSNKWSIGDVQEYGRVMKGVEGRVNELREIKAEHTVNVRQLESSMLRATARKEEVVRFDKAGHDSDFAKSLKARTLSPELLETQSQLRRQTRAMRDRIQKLEDHLKASKKRLHEMKTRKPSLRAPSLDLINRTYNNIDLAITNQADDIAHLTLRVQELGLPDPQPSSGTHGRRNKRVPEDHRLGRGGPSSGRRGPINVTPNVAATTAAALNAERAASKLKKSLLKLREEPLLNTQAIDSPIAYSDFTTPRKGTNGTDTDKNASGSSPGDPFNTPGWTGAIAAATAAGLSTPRASSTSEEESFGVVESHSLSGRQRSGGSTKKHTKAPSVKKSPGAPGGGFGLLGGVPGTPTPAGPPGFSWGPLPNVTQNSTSSAGGSSGGGGGGLGGGLPFPLTGLSSMAKPAAGTSGAGPSLSSSWVTDGFGVKK